MNNVIELKDIQLTWIKALDKFIDNKKMTFIIAEELIGENRPKPKKPFTTMKLISGPISAGSDENMRVDNDKFVLTSQDQFTVSLQSFGQGSFEALALFHKRLFGENLPCFLKEKLDIAIVDRGNVTDISALQNVGFERRHQLDIIFNMASNLSEDISSIETVKISGKIKDELDNERIVKEFTVTKP